MPKHKNIGKVKFQILGPSKSEPPSKTMPDGSGIVENHALFVILDLKKGIGLLFMEKLKKKNFIDYFFQINFDNIPCASS